jgi:selenocysteine lyase/cysteine desulfurase
MTEANPEGHPGKTGVIGFTVKSTMPATVARRLAFSGGMGVRFGCLCSHLIIKQISGFTPFQEKLQRFIVKMFPILNLQGIIRVSFGIQTTEEDVNALIMELRQINQKVRKDLGSGKPDKPVKDRNRLSNKEVKVLVREYIDACEMKVFG